MAEATRLHLAYRSRLARIGSAATAMVIAADTDDTDEFVAAVVPIVLTAQGEAVVSADTYMSIEAGLATGSTTETWGLDPSRLSGRVARGGTWLEDVYGRNHRTGGDFVTRMTREVTTDVTLAARMAARVHTEGDPRIVGYRRVLSTKKNCGLCIVAATRRYRKADLQPIHRSCGCTPAPIYSGTLNTPPNRGALDALYARAGGTDRESLIRLQVDAADLPEGIDVARLPDVDVVATPELGPTLVPA